MNILLFVNKDFEANLAYNLIKKELQCHNVKIYYSQSVGLNKNKPKDLLEIEFYEKAFFYNQLLNILKEDRIATDFEFFTDTFDSFPLLECCDVNSTDFIQEVKQFEPDLFISIRFGKIFRDSIIDIPKKGILNLHSAILPDYRGIMGTLHNLKDSKMSVYGCTLHYIDSATIDTGSIVGIQKLNIQEERSLFWHIVRLYPVGCDMIIEAIRALSITDKLPAINQDMHTGNYFSLPSDDDFKMLNNRGILGFKLEDYRALLGEYIASPFLDKLKIGY